MTRFLPAQETRQMTPWLISDVGQKKMPASFEYCGVLYYSTNGLILTYLDAIEKVAREDYGIRHPIVAWCEGEKTKFFPGAIVTLDSLAIEERRGELIAVLKKSAALLQRDSSLTQVGIDWMNRDFSRLITALEERG
jgi:hypothetical protein